MGEGTVVSAFSLSDPLNWFSGRSAWDPGTSEASPNTVVGTSKLHEALVPIFLSSSTPFRLPPKASGYPNASQHACFPWKAV